MIPEQVQHLAGNQVVAQTPYEGYYVTESGDIISTFVHGSNVRRMDADHARMLRKQTIKNGYQVVFIYRGGKSRTTYVHHIVLESFVGPRPEGYEACHNDGIRHHNHINNLRWDTTKANFIDSVNHGTHSRPPKNNVRGERNGQSRFTEAEILKMRELATQGLTQSEIGRRFNADQRTISDIVRRRSWAWLE